MFSCRSTLLVRGLGGVHVGAGLMQFDCDERLRAEILQADALSAMQCDPIPGAAQRRSTRIGFLRQNSTICANNYSQ